MDTLKTSQQLSQTNVSSLVSIIMPAFNAAKYIHEAIDSVLIQTHQAWELIVINDGSTDETESIVESYNDTRIQLVRQPNKGVSAARNEGLRRMQGQYVCFFDSDDVLPPKSLESRLKVFERNPNAQFVDGIIYRTNADINSVYRIWKPTFRGCPHRELVRIKASCFGTVSWMIRRDAIGQIRFREDITHAEDLLFFIELSPDRIYDYAEMPTLYFRRTGVSAMANLDALGKGYTDVFRVIQQKKLFPSWIDRSIYKIKMIKIMFLSHLAVGHLSKATRFVMKNLFV